MSEFKFLCPVCGQHIATDSTASGTQIECPTCFQKIIVPQAPKSDSKYILSATQYIKPPVSPPPPALPGKARNPGKGLGTAIFGLLALACAVLIGIHFLGGRSTPQPPPETPAPAPGSSAPSHAGPRWSLNLANADVPDAGAAGKVHGRDFICERAVLQNGALALRQNSPSDVSITIYLSIPDPHELGGKTFAVSTNNALGGPRIALRWKEGEVSMSQKFTNGYAMRLDFGPVTDAAVPGRVFFCAPDPEQSLVAGTFIAEIKKSSLPPRRQ